MKTKNKIYNFINSISFRIFLIVLCLGVVPFLVASAHFISRTESLNSAVFNQQIENSSQGIAKKLQTISLQKGTVSGELAGQLREIAEVFDGRVMLISSDLLIQFDSFSMDAGKTLISEAAVMSVSGETVSMTDKEHHRGVYAIPVYEINGSIQGAMIVDYSRERIDSVIDTMLSEFLVWGIAMVIVLFLLAMLFSYRIVNPFKLLNQKLQKYADGHSEVKFEVKGSTEIREMQTSLENMLQEMRKLEQRRVDFVSNVSHELKTPLTSMKLLADSIVQTENVSEEMYREFFTDVNSEVDRESKIIEDLLSLVKLEDEHSQIMIATVSINELIEIVLKRLRPIAEKSNIDLMFESYRNVLAEVDETKMALVISNLVENAIKYNREQGHVLVTLDADHRYFYLKVRDTGVGIPVEDRKYVFDRFYRVDKARSRETGGTGLGLAIVRDVILLHHGGIKISDAEGGGTIFTVRIPLSFITNMTNDD